jgi:hypothetical protein
LENASRILWKMFGRQRGGKPLEHVPAKHPS